MAKTSVVSDSELGGSVEGILGSKIVSHQARIAVIGLGYVGLPLAVELGKTGFSVLGLDLDGKKVNAINTGRSYISDIASEEVAALAAKELLTATTDFNCIAEVDVVFICVPTPFTKAKDPDLSFVVRATEEIATRLRPGQLVILESTTYPGTTEEVVKPILERSGLKAGKDFFLAFSPERVDPGSKNYSVRTTPKVVGGFTPRCTKLSRLLYEQVIGGNKIYEVSSPKVAEMTKLLENTFRSVNIALVNEMAQLCNRMGIDVWEVIDAAATKPFGYMPFYPGPGVGGHCIPVDPYYLSWKAREYDFHTKFIELAAEVNNSMPFYVVNRICDILNEFGRTIRDTQFLALGVAFKKDVDDARNSPALRVLRLLSDRGAVVQFHDPYIPQVRLEDEFSEGIGKLLTSVPLSKETLQSAHCTLVLVDHGSIDYQFVVDHSDIVIDTRNATRGVIRRGARVFGL